MKPILPDYQRIVTLSNQIAEYPPTRMNKIQFQALLVLISCIDSTVQPVFSIGDIKQEMEDLGIDDPVNQSRYLEAYITQQNTFRIPFNEYARYFTEGKTPRGGIIKRAYQAVKALNNKTIEFNNPDFEGSFVWFQAVYKDKKTDELVFTITPFIKPFLMGLRRDFLLMLAESTMNFDGKHSIPIFLYMKSKLYDGQDEFHGVEDIEVLKNRFGLNGIKTYNRFYELNRRVLEPASKDSLKSDDIKFFFKGMAKKGSKKITELHYSIYRIGDIRKLKIKMKELPSKKDNSVSKYEDSLKLYSRSQMKAYDFLTEKLVNKLFVIEKILKHDKLSYEMVCGFEDIYLKMLWEFFLTKTRAQKKAAAFVSWWKHGRLTTDNLHAKMVEKLNVIKNEMSIEALDNRMISKELTNKDFEEYLKYLAEHKKGNSEDSFQKKKNIDANSLFPLKVNRVFKFEEFKSNFPEQFDLIQESIITEYSETFSIDRESLDLKKYEKAIESRMIHLCRQWYLNNENG